MVSGSNNKNKQVIRRSLCVFVGIPHEDTAKVFACHVRSRPIPFRLVRRYPSICGWHGYLSIVAGETVVPKILHRFLAASVPPPQSIAITHDRDYLARVKITLTCYGAVVPIMVASLRLLLVSRCHGRPFGLRVNLRATTCPFTSA
jgi:hypothetical protein